MGIASLVLGINALVLGWEIPGFQWIGAMVGIIGIVLGAIGRKKNASCATAGLVCSIFGTEVCLLSLLIWTALVGILDSMLSGIF